MLGHELIHGYNRNFDEGVIKKKTPREWVIGKGYFGRREDYSTRKSNPFYPNAEEKYTTTLANQINDKLKEAIRYDHRGSSNIQMVSPTSNVPLKATAND